MYGPMLMTNYNKRKVKLVHEKPLPWVNAYGMHKYRHTLLLLLLYGTRRAPIVVTGGSLFLNFFPLFYSPFFLRRRSPRRRFVAVGKQ